MENHSMVRFWSLIYSTIKEFWAITEPQIEDAAVRNDIPIELYYYSELGLDYFSIANFQKRDPFSNPEKFERSFAWLDVKGWIEPMLDGRYQVTEKARDATRQIIQAGDTQLSRVEPLLKVNLRKLAILIKQVVTSCNAAAEPPQKWAILNRFRVVDKDSPWIAQIREYLMDLFAYRDDSHLSASHPHFGQAGIVWSVLGSIWHRDAVTAKQMAEIMAFRGYEIDDYEVAIKAASEIGWIEEDSIAGAFRLTAKGRDLREQAEALTNEYFYRSWSVMPQGELDEMYDLLTQLRDELHGYNRTR
jgi:hypothetical protein